MIKILLVEDDLDMLDLTAYVLRRERFVVMEASDGAAALRRWRADRPDLVVLDLGLPSLDGFEVLRRIRADDETPILVLTGRRDAQDILRVFNLGSDDFLAKPFEFKELIARIRAILRRVQTSPKENTEPRVEVDGLKLDPEAYEVAWRDAYVRLTPTEFRILYLLVTNAGHVVSANRLYTYVWGSEGGDANALRSHISHLRRKLETTGETPGTISSVPAIGYVYRKVAQPATVPVETTAIAPSAPSSKDDRVPTPTATAQVAPASSRAARPAEIVTQEIGPAGSRKETGARSWSTRSSPPHHSWTDALTGGSPVNAIAPGEATGERSLPPGSARLPRRRQLRNRPLARAATRPSRQGVCRCSAKRKEVFESTKLVGKRLPT